MNRILKSFRVVSLSFLFFASLSHAEIYKIGAAGVQPLFADTDINGNLAGFEIELGQTICREIKIECEFIKVSLAKLFPALKDKKIDIIMSGLYVTDSRLESADAAKPYMIGGARFIKLKSSNLEFTPGTLENKKVGVISDTIFQDYIKSNYSGNLTIKTYLNREDNVKALLEKEIDFIFDDITVLDYYIQKYISTIEFFGPQVDDPKWFKGKSAYFRKADSQLKDKFNAAIIKLRSTREFQKISQKYFHKDIYQ